MSVMMRQIMTPFEKYQSKKNAVYTLLAMKEDARHATEIGRCRRSVTGSSLPSDPIHSNTVRLICRLALKRGMSSSGQMARFISGCLKTSNRSSRINDPACANTMAALLQQERSRRPFLPRVACFYT